MQARAAALEGPRRCCQAQPDRAPGAGRPAHPLSQHQDPAQNFTVETEFVPKDASGGHLGWVFENQDSTFQWKAQFQFDTDEILAT